MKSLSTNITHLTLIDCSNFLQSINWATLEKLVYLDIYLLNDDRDAGLKLCSISKNLRHLIISGLVQMDVAGISFEAGFGFPELRSLKFTGKSWDDTDRKAFRYCCANSPKLEDIHIFGGFESTETYDSVAQSIGSLLSRPALRKLELEIDDYRESSERFVGSITNLINCPDEKPKLKNLILHPNCSLSSIYQFVNGNYNLKSLELYGKVHEKETLADIIKILNCESGLETIRFSGQSRYSLRFRPEDAATRLGGLVSRDEFPKLIEDLQKIVTGGKSQS